MKSFDYVTKEVETDNGLSIKDSLRFHYFNPNGLYAKKLILDDQIAALVDSGAVPSGWHLAYGTLDYHYADRLAKLAGRRTAPSKMELHTLIVAMTARNAYVTSRIAEVLAGVN